MRLLCLSLPLRCAPRCSVLLKPLPTGGLPRALFKATGNDYEPSPDGQRFLFIESGEEADTSPATVVLNWPALLEDDD